MRRCLCLVIGLAIVIGGSIWGIWWHLGHVASVRTYPFPKTPPYQIVESPDGRLVAAINSHCVNVHDCSSGRIVFTTHPPEHQYFGNALCWTSDSRELLLSNYRHLDVWDVATGKRLCRTPHTYTVLTCITRCAESYYTAGYFGGDFGVFGEVVEWKYEKAENNLRIVKSYPWIEGDIMSVEVIMVPGSTDELLIAVRNEQSSYVLWGKRGNEITITRKVSLPVKEAQQLRLTKDGARCIVRCKESVSSVLLKEEPEIEWTVPVMQTNPHYQSLALQDGGDAILVGAGSHLLMLSKEGGRLARKRKYAGAVAFSNDSESALVFQPETTFHSASIARYALSDLAN